MSTAFSTSALSGLYYLQTQTLSEAEATATLVGLGCTVATSRVEGDVVIVGYRVPADRSPSTVHRIVRELTAARLARNDLAAA